ncbi:MAG: GntR family transcriptional regulator [Thermomicrobiales bacterium]
MGDGTRTVALDNGRGRPAAGGRSLAEEAYARIRRRIIECELAPGQQFTEGLLVEAHGIGKTPVREALQRLAQDGLVQPIRRHGYRVSPITLRDVRDLFGLRLILEPAGAELAIGRIDLAHLREIQARYDACYLDDPVAAFLLNTAFHLASAQASGNARLAKTMTQLLTDSERLYVFGFRFQSPGFQLKHMHEELIDAFASGDPRCVRECAVAQIVDAERMVTEALLHSPTLLDADVTLAGVNARPIGR